MMKESKENLEEGKEGYFAGLVDTIIQNVQINIKNIHIQLQHNQFNLGMTVE